MKTTINQISVPEHKLGAIERAQSRARSFTLQYRNTSSEVCVLFNEERPPESPVWVNDAAGNAAARTWGIANGGVEADHYGQIIAA